MSTAGRSFDSADWFVVDNLNVGRDIMRILIMRGGESERKLLSWDLDQVDCLPPLRVVWYRH